MLAHIDRYMARLMVVPMAASLTVAAMLLLLERMLHLFNFVITEGGPVSVVWQMLANLMPEQFGFSLPISLLLGVMLAVRHLALNSELDALLSAGVSHGRLLRMPLIFAVLLGAVTFWLVGFEQPYSRYSYERLRFELQTGALGASIKVGEFAKISKEAVLRVERSENGGRQLRGIFLRAEDGDHGSVVVSAERAKFLATDDPDLLLLRLFRGVMMQAQPDQSRPRVLSFTTHDIPIDLPRIAAFRKREEQVEFTVSELWQLSGDRKRTDEFQRRARGTLHRRLVQVAVLFPLPFLGLALAVPPKRSTTSVGIFAGIFLLLLFNEFNKAGEDAVRLGLAEPWLAIWTPYAGFCALSVGAYLILTRKVGGEPLGPVLAVGRAVQRLFGRAKRRAMRWHHAHQHH